MSIKTELVDSFKNGTTVTRLIYFNIAVFILVNIISMVCTLMLTDSAFILNNLALPAEPMLLLQKPWTLLSHMFTHKGFFHGLFNILNLFWFGRLFLLFFNQKQLFGLYILGGIAGGLFFIITYNAFPYFAQVLSGSSLHGASAAVLAIIMGVAAYSPNMELQMLFIGKVKLKFLAAIIFFLSLFSIVGENAGGNMAHLGGMLMGYLFAIYMKKGKDLTLGVNRAIVFFVDLFSQKPKMKASKGARSMNDYDWNAKKTQESKALDDILDKIKHSGYESLSSEEKKRLFDQSNKI